jgi:hypothetical protein
VLSEVALQIRRVGEPTDFASYAPINIVANVLTFQFDSYLFGSPYGRYEGTLVFNNIPYASLQFEFVSTVSINPSLQLSTIGPYRKEREYGNPDWSGTGVAGPGTFIGLKDCPKTYAGASGKLLSVRSLENGIEFVGLVAGANITFTVSDGNITIAASGGGSGGGQVNAVVAGTNITVNNTDPANPVVSGVELIAGTNITLTDGDGSITIAASGGGGGGGQVNTIVGGANITVNSTNPANPVVSGVPIYASGELPAAPSGNGILCVYLGTLSPPNPHAGGMAYSFSGAWVDMYSNTIVPTGT